MKSEFCGKGSCKSICPAPAAVLVALCLLALTFLLPLSLWGEGKEGGWPPAADDGRKKSEKVEKSRNFFGEDQEGEPADDGRKKSEKVEKSRKKSEENLIRLLEGSGKVTELPLEDYVWGAVAGEMPAAFPMEALKAQAVAARTYALRQGERGTHRDQGAHVCSDPGCCQAWLPPAEARARWGDQGDFYADKLTQAAAETAGEVLTYDGALIDAVYHASSEGATADAQSVWSRPVPYLVSVTTPETEEDVPNFRTTVRLPPEEFAGRFRAAYPEAQLTGDPAGWFSGLTRAPWGGVTAVEVGGVPVTGSALRGLLGLRSARFAVEADKEAVTFTVTAYGHGVGMSQYGAAAMAREGAGYREILGHYYPGTEVERAG